MSLQLDLEQRLQLSAPDFVGACVAVLGIRGSGKSSTTGVLVEELAPHTSLTVVDIEGEYWGLKEQFDLLVVGRSPHVDLEITPAQGGDIARFVLSNHLSAILDMSDFDQDEMVAFLTGYFSTLWDESTRLRIPHQIVLEEAHEFVPQDGHSPLRDLLTRIALRGRKRGLGLMAVSQRSANVSKSVLTQASILFLHRVTHPADMAVYKNLIPLAGKEVEASVRGLKPGQAVVLVNGETQIVQMRPRKTFHGGATPGLEAAVPTLRTIDAKLLAELQRALITSRSERIDPTTQSALDQVVAERDALARQVEELTAERDALTRELAVLRASPQTLKVTGDPLAVEMSGVVIRPPAADEPVRSDRALKLAAGRQRRKFEHLKDTLRDLPRWYRDMLAVLETQPEGLPTRQLIRRLGLSESTFMKHPPVRLVRLGVIERKQEKSLGQVYRTRLHQQLAEEYPDLDTPALVRELLGMK